ncbi:hypothetical protein [Streptomyces smyrnaeus]|uniref:hypothetical protein n=1 Tax=Streptomyces smyrnaeus TaxID=1387713 RepID=UPI0033EF5AD1
MTEGFGVVGGLGAAVPASAGARTARTGPAAVGCRSARALRRADTVRRWARGAAGRLAGLSGAALLTVLATIDGTYGESRALFAGTCLLVLVQAAAYRWAPRREALVGGAVAAAATALWTVPLLLDASFFEAAGLAAFWCLPSVGAAAVGGYPRLMDRRRARAVRDA